MPPKGKKLGKKSPTKGRAPKGAAKTRQSRRVSTGVRGSSSRGSNPLGSLPRGAPAGVSKMARTGISFSSTNMGKDLIVHATLPFCEVGTDAKANGLLMRTSTTDSPATVILLNPFNLLATSNAAGLVDGIWMSPQVSLMAAAFDKYCLEALEWVYEPQATTSVVDRLVFAYADDPVHPVLVPSSGFPSQTDLLITPDSVAFAPWLPWSLRVNCDKKDEKYVFSTINAASFGDDGARLAYSGVLACVASSVTPAVYGVLYARVTYRFTDPVPVSNTSIAMCRAIRAARDDLTRTERTAKQSRSEKKEDLRPEAGSDPSSVKPARIVTTPSGDVVRVDEDDEWNRSPPVYKPAPSTAPGAPTYTPKVPSRK